MENSGTARCDLHGWPDSGVEVQYDFGLSTTKIPPVRGVFGRGRLPVRYRRPQAPLRSDHAEKASPAAGYGIRLTIGSAAPDQAQICPVSGVDLPRAFADAAEIEIRNDL